MVWDAHAQLTDGKLDPVAPTAKTALSALLVHIKVFEEVLVSGHHRPSGTPLAKRLVPRGCVQYGNPI